MTALRQDPGTPRRAAHQYGGVLTDIFEFMLASGISRADIRTIASDVLQKAKPSNLKISKDLSGHLSTAALVLDAWHRDRRYLDIKANPKAIRLFGPAPSVEALIRDEPGSHKPSTLVRQLINEKLIIPCGRNWYKPASNVALVTVLNPAAIQHIVRSLKMLLETIRRNLESPDLGGRLIERIAEVPDLPLDQIRPFQDFTRIQGSILLRTVNDWLEGRRAKVQVPGKRVVRAGIHVHSVVGAVKNRRT